jgi:hypothetical protein
MEATMTHDLQDHDRDVIRTLISALESQREADLVALRARVEAQEDRALARYRVERRRLEVV